MNHKEKMTLRCMEKDIAKAKRELSKRELYENFGQSEVREIRDRYNDMEMSCEMRKAYQIRLDNFDFWCSTYFK